LCDQADQIFSEEENILYVDDPVAVVGDIHGQYFDLLKVLELGGEPNSNK